MSLLVQTCDPPSYSEDYGNTTSVTSMLELKKTFKASLKNYCDFLSKFINRHLEGLRVQLSSRILV